MATHTGLKDYIGINPAPDFATAEAIERGIPAENLSFLREKGLTFSEMAAVIPHRTLQHRKARGENLSLEETERAIRIASVIALAEKTFGDPEKAMRWLRGKDDRLADRTPLSLLKTEAGAKLIISMLVGIDEGFFSGCSSGESVITSAFLAREPRCLVVAGTPHRPGNEWRTSPSIRRFASQRI